MHVKTIDLVNVKGFEKLRFDFKRPDGTFHGWTVIVGGNASGKSTLLKAIALSLVGPSLGIQSLESGVGWLKSGERFAEAEVGLLWDAEFDTLPEGVLVDPSSELMVGLHWQLFGGQSDTFLRGGRIHPSSNLRMGLSFGEQRGQEREIMGFTMRGPADPDQLRPEATRYGPGNPSLSGWFCAGYGPMRRLSGSSWDAIRENTTGGPLSRFITLLREDAALNESEAWLKLNHARHLESGNAQLQALIEGVRNLLNDGLLPHGMTISRITVDHVYVLNSLGIELPMRDLSDGCRSVYAMVLDIVRGMAEDYGVPGLFVATEPGRVVVDRPGVVLIDEIEAHLHPRWQSEIPEWLKAHFPRIQFIVSTHSALVAQAADPNGVFVLPSQDEPGRAPRQLDPHEYDLLRLRRAEKTLLGSAFGLKTTRSKWAIDQIERWKRLNAKARAGARLSAQEQADLTELKAQMEVAFAESVPGSAEEAAP